MSNEAFLKRTSKIAEKINPSSCGRLRALTPYILMFKLVITELPERRTVMAVKYLF